MMEAGQPPPYKDIFWIQRVLVQYLIELAQTFMKKDTKLKVFSRFKGKEVEYLMQCNSRIYHEYFTNAAKVGKNIKVKLNQVKLYFWHKNS